VNASARSNEERRASTRRGLEEPAISDDYPESAAQTRTHSVGIDRGATFAVGDHGVVAQQVRAAHRRIAPSTAATLTPIPAATNRRWVVIHSWTLAE
jgi:hypothetical protein